MIKGNVMIKSYIVNYAYSLALCLLFRTHNNECLYSCLNNYHPWDRTLALWLQGHMQSNWMSANLLLGLPARQRSYIIAVSCNFLLYSFTFEKSDLYSVCETFLSNGIFYLHGLTPPRTLTWYWKIPNNLVFVTRLSCGAEIFLCLFI